MKRIFIDCSYLSEHVELNTGIQRVVRRVIENLELISNEKNFEVIPVNIGDAQLKKVEIQNLYKHKSIEDETKQSISYKVHFREYLKNIYRAIRTLIVAVVPHKSVQRFLFSSREQFGLNYIINKIFILPIKYFSKRKIPQNQDILEDNLSFEKDDVLLLLDSTWYMNIWPTVKIAKEKDVKVIAVIYDLIPITHPQFCDDFLVEVFKKWFFDSLTLVDSYITISASVKEDLILFLNKEFGDIAKSKKFEHFLLGSDFNYTLLEKSSVREELKSMYKNKNTYLIVSTIEPRKNHLYLLDVFDRLWAQDIDINLCIVGRIGWKVEKIMDRITKNKQLNKKLFHWSDLNDDELLYCYKNSKMLLFPSIVEGFGLPIVESLSNGLPVMASDTPIHREVGQNMIDYFDILDTNDLTSKLIDIQKNSVPDKFIPDKNYRWQDWNESTRILLEKIIKIK